MKYVSLHEAKARLSGLVSQVEEGGDEVVISRYGRPVAQLVAYNSRKRCEVDALLSRVEYCGDLTESTQEEWESA